MRHIQITGDYRSGKTTWLLKRAKLALIENPDCYTVLYCADTSRVVFQKMASKILGSVYVKGILGEVHFGHPPIEKTPFLFRETAGLYLPSHNVCYEEVHRGSKSHRSYPGDKAYDHIIDLGKGKGN